MKRTRTCNSACYNAVTPECDCICNSVFHGKAGEANRKAIMGAVGALPRNEGEMLLLRHAAKAMKRLSAYDGTRRLLNG